MLNIEELEAFGALEQLSLLIAIRMLETCQQLWDKRSKKGRSESQSEKVKLT